MRDLGYTPIGNSFKGKDILSITQFDAKSIHKLFSFVPKMADIAKHAKASHILEGNIVSILFFEPSSRTFNSFAASVKQLGGQTLEQQNPMQFSSFAKGESLEDAIKVFEAYCDAIILRHPEVGTAKKAADAAFFVPVINAGDGIGEHPTQALLDMYTIYEKFGRLDNLTGVLAGDMLNGRTVHSLIQGLSQFRNNTLYLLSPESLKLKEDDLLEFQNRGVKLIEIDSENDIPKDSHFWYWTRVQKERFSDPKEYEKVKHAFIVTPKLLEEYASKHMILMHPLPRVGEISTAVDSDTRSVYLTTQIRNGMYVRMALLGLVLGKL